jgi:hypothetical protein
MRPWRPVALHDCPRIKAAGRLPRRPIRCGALWLHRQPPGLDLHPLCPPAAPLGPVQPRSGKPLCGPISATRNHASTVTELSKGNLHERTDRGDEVRDGAISASGTIPSRMQSPAAAWRGVRPRGRGSLVSPCHGRAVASRFYRSIFWAAGIVLISHATACLAPRQPHVHTNQRQRRLSVASRRLLFGMTGAGPVPAPMVSTL